MFSRLFPRKPTAPKAARASALGLGAGRDLFAVEAMEPRILLSAAPIDAPLAMSDVSALPDSQTQLDQSVQHSPAATLEMAVLAVGDTSHIFGDTSALPEVNPDDSANPSASETEVVSADTATLSPTSESPSFETHQDEQILTPTDPVIDSMTDELVTTLHAANGPPAGADTTTPDVNFSNTTLTPAPLSAEAGSIQAPASEGELLSSANDGTVSENSQTATGNLDNGIIQSSAPAPEGGGAQPASTGPVQFGPISFQLTTDADRQSLEDLLNGGGFGPLTVSGWLRISDFVYISGTFTFTKKPTQNLDVRTGLDQTEANAVLGSIPTSDTDGGTLARNTDGSIIWNLPVETFDIEMTGVDVFVGYTESLDAAAADGNLTKAELESAGAIGLVLDNVNIGLVLMKALPVDPLTLGAGTLNLAQLKFFALKADANNVSLLGVPGLDLGADNLQVRVNQGSFTPGTWGDNVAGVSAVPVVDFALSGGYQVGSTVSLSYNNQILGASADRILLRVSDFVYVSGGFSFNKGPVRQMDVRTNLTGLTAPQKLALFGAMTVSETDTGTLARNDAGTMIWNLPTQTIDVGLSNVDIFVGYTDGSSNALASAAADGELTKAELEAAGAIGLFLDEASMGMLIGSAMPVLGAGSLNTAFLKFFSLQVDATLVELLGVPALNLSVDNLQVRVNQGSFVPGVWPAVAGLTPPPVIDYKLSFPDDSWDPSNPDGDSNPDGYRVQTDTLGSYKALLFEQAVVGASADRVLLRVSDFVYVSGGFSFNKGGVRNMDVRTNLTNLTAPQKLALFGSMSQSESDTGAVARNSAGTIIWNLPVQTIDVGLSNVDVFVGYTDGSSNALASAAVDGELTKAELEAANAIGLFLDEASMGMLIGSALPVAGAGTLNSSFLKFFSLQVDASAELLGVPALNLAVDSLQVRVNQGSFVPGVWPSVAGLMPPPVIDFKLSFPDDSWDASNPDGDSNPDGYRVPTDTSGSYKALLFEQAVVGASADRVLLRVSDFVYVSGGFSFNKGGVKNLDIRTNLTGLTSIQKTGLFGSMATSDTDTGALARNNAGTIIWNLPVQTIDVGLSNVDVFVGYTDGSSNALASAAVDGELTKAELEAANAIGLFLDEASMGMLIGSAMPVAGAGTLNTAFLKFFSLQVDASAELLGVPGLNLAVDNLQVRVNQGSYVSPAWPTALPGLLPPPVIDFKLSFPDDSWDPSNPDGDSNPDGYRVQTDTSGSYKALLFDQAVVGASADRVLLRVSDFVYVSGGFSFNKGGVKNFDIRTNLTALTLPQKQLLFGSMDKSETDQGTLARNEDGTIIWNLPVQTIDIGLTNVDVFVGYTDGSNNALANAALDGELTKVELEAANAIGLLLDEASLGMLIGSALPVSAGGFPVTGLNSSFLKFFSLQADASLVELLGVPGLNLSVDNLQVRVNQGSYASPAWPISLPGVLPPPVIDYKLSFPDDSWDPSNPDGDSNPDGYRVPTNTSGSYKALLFDQAVTGASADRVLLRVSDFVYVSGGFSFNKGGVKNMDIRTNLTALTAPQKLALFGTMAVSDTDTGALARNTDGTMIWNLPVQTIDVGLNNVDVFVGYTDGSSNALASAAVDGELTKAELLAANAIGLFLDEASMGMFIGSALPVSEGGLPITGLNSSFLKFFSLQVDASAELLGVPELNLAVDNLQVRVNQGSYISPAWPIALPGVMPPPVVDFKLSFPDDSWDPSNPDGDSNPDGYRVPTDTSGSFKALLFDQPVVGASADRVLLRVSDFVYVSGGFSFNKGPVRQMDIRTNLTALTAPQKLALFGLMDVSDTDTGALARNTDGTVIWNLPVQTIDVGLTNVDVFVGYTDGSSNALANAALDGELTKAELEAANAIGLLLDEASLGMLIANALPVTAGGLPVTGLNSAFLKFFSLQADASLVELLGVPGLDLAVENLQVRVNQGSFVPGAWPAVSGVMPPPVIDFKLSFPDNSWDPSNPDGDSNPDGYRVQTDTSGSYKALLFENAVIGASADRVLLRVSDFVYISGGFSFNKGGVEYVDVKTNLNQVQATTVLGTLMGQNTGNTGTTLGASSNGSVIYNLPIQTIDIGLSNVDVFVGYTDGSSNVLENAAKLTGELTEADLLAAKAVGLFVDEANLGMVIGSALPVTFGGLPVVGLNTAALKFFSLKADANLVALVGIPGVELSGRGIRVEVNSGSKFPTALANVVGPAIDWSMSYPDTDGAGTDDFTGYEVATGTTTDPAVLAMDGYIIGGGVENVHIELGDYVYIDGAIYFEMGKVQTVQLADSFLPIGDTLTKLGLDSSLGTIIGATEKEVAFLSIGGKDLQAFFGINGPYWVDADNDGIIDRDPVTQQIIDAETNDDAVGLVIDNLTFGLTLATPTNTLDPSRYVALKGTANMIGLVGLEDYVTMRAENILVELNISTPLVGGFPLLPVIDWVDTFGENGYGVKTGARNPDLTDITVDLDMESLLIKAGIGFMTMDVLGIVSLSGSMGIEIGKSSTVTLADGSTKDVKTLTFGAANVYGFIGYNGPYVHDSNGNGYVDRGDFNTGPGGALGTPIAYRDGQAGRPKAVGFAINDLDIGLMVMAATDPLDAGLYIAAKLDVESYGLVGISGLSAAGRFDVNLNVGFGLSGLDPNISPVDFGASFSEAPALFALMDADHNNIIDQAEQNAALASGYIGSNITTAAQLVSILNASNGPPDEYLNISEVLAKLKDSFEAANQAAIDALDADDNGRLNSGYEVYTGDAANPIVLDFDNFLISVQLGGQIKLDGMFRMYGVFLFQVDPTGLKAFVAAGLEIGPDIDSAAGSKIFTMNALGALVINGAGLAADIEVSISIGGALQSVLSLNASARLVFNTTGADQTITIPERYAGFITGADPIVGALPGSTSFDPAQAASLAGKLDGRFTTNPDGSLTFTIDRRAPRLGGGFDPAGSYFLVAIQGNLTIVQKFVISANFQLKISGAGLELGYNGTIDLGGFVTVNVAGGAVFEGGVFAAYNNLSIDITISGVRISGGAVLEINTGAGRNVYDALANPHFIAANTYMLTVDATIDLFGVLTAHGDVRIGITGGNFLIDVNATLSFFGIIDVSISGYFNTNGNFSFTGSLNLDLTVGSGASEFGITGGLSVTLTNSGFSGHGEVGLVIFGEDINIASATVSVNWVTGAWLIRAEGPLSVWLEVRTDGNGGFEITGGLGFFDDVLEVLGDVADAIAEGVTAAANAIADALVDLGEAILEFGEDVVEFFESVGEAIADAAQAVWDEISSWFEDERTVITQYTINPRDYYVYSTSLVGGVLTITNGTGYGYGSNLTFWVVDGNLIVDAPDYTRNVVISTSQKQERDYTWDGWPPYGEWGPWYNVGAAQTQTADINITNASNFAIGSVTKIVINGTDNTETIILDRNTVSINTDVHANGGDDIISTGTGNDRVWGGNGNDVIFTYEGNDELYGEALNDKLFGGLGNDFLNGGSGDDLLDENKDRVDPGTLLAETNSLIGGTGNDTILGSPGKDTIIGGSGDDILLGLSNDDTYVFENGYGTDKFVDYNGVETLNFAGATVSLPVTGGTVSFSAVSASLQGSMSDSGITFSAGSGNFLSIDQFAAINLIKLGSGNDHFDITKLPGFHLDITDAGGADIYDFDFDLADSNQAVASVTIQDNGGSIDRIELDVDSTGHPIYLHPLEVLLNNLDVSFNTGIEQLALTDHAANTTITTSPDSGLITLLLKNGVTVTSATGGTIEFHARLDFTLETGALIQTTGNVIIRGDHDDTDSTGAVISLLGTINADQVTVHGGDDNDTVIVGNVTSGSETTIWTYGGADTVNIRTINAATIVNAGLGNDVANVGSLAPATGGTLDGIGALLTINGDGGTDILNLDDTGDTNANTGSLTSTTVTGLDMGGSIAYAAIATLNIGLGSNGDVFTIISTHAGVTNLNSNAGADIVNIRTIGGATTVDAGIGSDTINIGSNAAGIVGNANNNSGGTVDGIAALLTIIGNDPTSGSDWLYVDDSGDTNPNTGILTSTTITGLDMGGSITYGTVEHLVISLGTGGNTFTINSTHGAATSPYQEETIVNSGSGADTVHINSVTDLLIVNGQAGADVINVNGTGAGSETTVNGGTGNDTVNINDVTNLLVVNGGADADTINVNGTGAGSLSTLNGDAGNDTFNIRGMDGRVNVRGGADNDTINVTDVAPLLPAGPRTTATGSIDGIDALLDIDGGTGTLDILNIDDSRAATSNDKSGTLTSNTVRGLELDVGIDYVGLESLNIWLGYGDNLFTIDGTHAGSTTLFTAQGEDTVNINSASGLLTINAEQDNDVVNVRAADSGSEVRINGHEGADIINLSNLSPSVPSAYPATLPPPAADRIGVVDFIDGLLVLQGGIGFDVVNVDDSGSTAAKAGTLSSNTLRGLGLAAGVNYSELEDFNLWLGTGADVLFIDSTHAGTTDVFAGDGNATLNQRDDTIGIRSIAGVTTIHGQAGNDFIEVNVTAATLPQNASFPGTAPIVGFFTRTHQNGLAAVLNLHGEGDSDRYTVNLAHAGTAMVNVFDNGAPANGADTLVINGADVVVGVTNNPHDTFLLRRNFVALLNDSADENADLDQVERVNYDENINARLIVNGLGGNDAFAADDNSAITTLDGGDGNDRFQIGQVFGTPRDAAANIAAGDTFGTTPVIIGVIRDPNTNALIFDPAEDALTATVIARIQQAIVDAGNQPLDGIAYVSNGVTHPTTVFGGEGNDTFSVYHNKGVLRLEGENGNDEFLVRAFVILQGAAQAETEVLGGGGQDSIQYAINAPVSIDGGAGFDSVVVLGTPFADNFVVTSYGIFGAGLNVRFFGVERAELDALEGDDTIYIISTSEKLVTTVIGGLGNDTINVMGDVTERIVSNDLLGRSGLITHGILTGDPGYLNTGVNGVSTSVISASGGSLVDISPFGDPLRVSEDGLISSYFIMLTGPLAADFSTVYLTVSAGVASSRDRQSGGASVLVSTDGVNFTEAVVLTFNAANAQQQIYIKAVNDSAVEGERLVMISHSINSASASYDNLALPDMQVVVVDNDRPGIDIVQVGTGGVSDSMTQVLEGPFGFGDIYRIRLTTAPAPGETVTITLLHDGQIQLSQTVLTFTLGGPTAWNLYQDVTITATDDAAADGTRLSSISHVMTSSVVGSAFNLAAAENPVLDVTVYDNDTAGVIVRETGGSTIVVDGGAGDSYWVRLTKLPASLVTLSLTTDTQTKLLVGDASRFSIIDENAADGLFQYTLTFDATNWSEWVEVQVTANSAYVGGGSPTKTFAPTSQNLDQIRGPLIIEGGVMAGKDRSLAAAIVLPGEFNEASGQESPVSDESQQIDRLNIFHTDNEDADSGFLLSRSSGIVNTGTALTGLGMGGDRTFNEGTDSAPVLVTYGGGITYAGVEIFELLLGKGDENLTVSDTADGAITLLHGGGGSDTITVSGRGQGPLVIYGDTSQDGLRYSNTTGAASVHGSSFSNFGNDIINASALGALNDGFAGVVIYGGAGADQITGSQDFDHLAGGSGADVINGQGGNDHIYGDGHFNVDPVLFARDQITRFNASIPAELALINSIFTVLTSTDAYGDELHGNDGNDIILADHGVITQSAGTRRLEASGSIERIETTVENAGGIDNVTGGAGHDVIFGGHMGDVISGNDGSDLIFGDHGFVDYVTRDGTVGDIDVISSTSTTSFGGVDQLNGGEGDDTIIGGRFSDTIHDSGGNNIVFGDSGIITAATANTARRGDGLTLISLGRIETTAYTDGGADDITTGAGMDIILGGISGNATNGDTGQPDVIRSGAGADIVLGDHGQLVYDSDATGNPATLDLVTTTQPLIGGTDQIFGGGGNDFIFGGTGADLIYGDRLAAGTPDVVDAIADSDLIFGDHGEVRGVVNPAHIGIANASFVFTSIDTGAADGGAADVIYAGSGAVPPLTDFGRNIILGGQGADTIYGGNGDDDIIGGHNVANGSDTGDFIDGGAGNDTIAGDNARIVRSGANAGPRFGVLTGTLIYNSNGLAMVSTTVTGANPAQTEARLIELFDHDNSANNTGNFGDDLIAGGADDDEIFGQLGNDTIQGDGKLVDGAGGLGLAILTATVSGSDVGGDDYIEGNGGDDLIFGGLGQDDLIGGSSSLYNLLLPSQRPDGSDTIFGGNGDMISRNNEGNGVVNESGTANVTAGDLHARDSDMILGDNGNIIRLVGINNVAGSSLLVFGYDNYSATRKIVVRAATLLDYTPGGPDNTSNTADDLTGIAINDIGAADFIHGESGDDFIYGMVGGDILFGDAQDDDLIGGYGNDWISGGTGQDGVLGDDGRIFTSRNGTAEALYGIGNLAGQLDIAISTPGNVQQAVINVTGALKKTADLTPFNPVIGGYELSDPKFADDIIYGGWGDDFLHGGSGDDAMSGAEALPEYFAAPFNPGNVLRYSSVTGEFAEYNEFQPLVRIVYQGSPWFANGAQFILNFDHTEGAVAGTVRSDGNDAIFGDLGNDWIVGGTGRDNLYGGWGDDLLNADDDLSTNGGLNNTPDTNASYEDRAFGGAGRDRLIANTGGDRLIDWAGEFNSYLVPFAPFGLGTVSRALQPQIPEFLYALSKSDGADPTRGTDARNGEPFGELGLVRQQDFAWRDQTGAPDDPQPGNIPGGARDVLRSASFDNNSLSGLFADSGYWLSSGGTLQVGAQSLGGDAVAVYHVGDQLPGYFEIQASVTAMKPTSGWKANSYIIFDYQSETDFKFAGLDVSLSKLVMGHRDANGWYIDEQAAIRGGVKADTSYNLLLAVNGVNATLILDNSVVFSHTYQARIVDGYAYGLNWGMVGVGSNNARGTFDNIRIQVLPPQLTYDNTESFAGSVKLSLSGASNVFWSQNGGRYSVTPGRFTATSMIDLGPDHLNFNSNLELSATVRTMDRAGIIFDRYGDESYKFVVIDAKNQKLVIGHYTQKSGWVEDSAVSTTIKAGQEYVLTISFTGGAVNASLKAAGQTANQAITGYVFNASTVDGGFGVIASGGFASFDEIRVKTNDPVFIVLPSDSLIAAAGQVQSSNTTAVLTQAQLDAVTNAAIANWTKALGKNSLSLARLADIRISIADLAAGELGTTHGRSIMIDKDAAGHGWFIDKTPSDSSEFRLQKDGRMIAPVGSQSSGKMDLLTVITHEIGHLLGLGHDDAAKYPVMQDVLDAGVRYVPGKAMASAKSKSAKSVFVREVPGARELPMSNKELFELASIPELRATEK